MKKIALGVLFLTLFLTASGFSQAASDLKEQPASGSIIGGFRVLVLPDKAENLELTVYRGDYIKFRFNPSISDPVLSVPDLSIQERLPAEIDDAPYFKMGKTGVFPFSLGAAKGSIIVIDYRQASYREVNPQEAAELIRNIKPLILDVRTPAEYGGGHLEGSVLIPVQQLQARWREIEGYKENDVLIYCATGNRSTVAAKILIDNGFRRIFNLRPGMAGWKQEKHPLVQ